MTEKHINKISKPNSSDDEWSHITGVGTKIDSSDPLSIVDRNIVFGKNHGTSSKEDAFKEKSIEVQDQMSNTNQYLKFVNSLLREKKDRLERLKESEKKFKEELALFKGDTIVPREELEKIQFKNITKDDLNSTLTHLKNEHQSLVEKLAFQEQQIEKTRQEILQKSSNIEQITKELEAQPEEKPKDPIDMIKEEMARLGIGDNSKIDEAIKLLSNSNKNL